MKKITIKNQALIYLGKREYGVFELQEKLQAKFPDSETEILEVLTFLQSKDWLSDKRFLESFIREKQQQRQGWYKIYQKLKQKGFDNEVLAKAQLDYFEEETEFQNMIYLATKKYETLGKRSKKLNHYELKNKIKAFLISRGFGFQVIDQGLEELFDD